MAVLQFKDFGSILGGMEVALLNKLYTVKEVAESLQVTTVHISRLCKSLGVGQMSAGAWFLSSSDVEAIRDYRKQFGRNRLKPDQQ